MYIVAGLLRKCQNLWGRRMVMSLRDQPGDNENLHVWSSKPICTGSPNFVLRQSPWTFSKYYVSFLQWMISLVLIWTMTLKMLTSLLHYSTFWREREIKQNYTSMRSDLPTWKSFVFNESQEKVQKCIKCRGNGRSARRACDAWWRKTILGFFPWSIVGDR